MFPLKTKALRWEVGDCLARVSQIVATKQTRILVS